MRRTVAISMILVFISIVLQSPIRAADGWSVEQVSRVDRIDRLVMQSEALGEEVSVLVRLPRDYDAGSGRYPVLFLLDAQWHFNIAAADVELLSECSYIDPHPVPPLIVVGVASNDRNRDYTPSSCPEYRGMRFPTSGGSADFRRFLIEELIPAVDEIYRTHHYRILAGWSLGGLFTVETLLDRTQGFNTFLAISPSLWWDDELILKRFSADRAVGGSAGPAKLIVTLGSYEKGGMVERSTNAFMGYLEEHPMENVTVELVPIEGLGHNYSPKMAYFSGLATVFGDWNAPSELVDKGIEAVDTYYRALSGAYGFEIAVPEGVYSRMGWGLFEDGNKDGAREVFVTWSTRHPESPLSMASLGAFLKETGDNEDAIRYLTAAVQLEERSSNPRMNFILDLKRDIDRLEAGE